MDFERAPSGAGSGPLTMRSRSLFFAPSGLTWAVLYFVPLTRNVPLISVPSAKPCRMRSSQRDARPPAQYTRQTHKCTLTYQPSFPPTCLHMYVRTCVRLIPGNVKVLHFASLDFMSHHCIAIPFHTMPHITTTIAITITAATTTTPPQLRYAMLQYATSRYITLHCIMRPRIASRPTPTQPHHTTPNHVTSNHMTTTHITTQHITTHHATSHHHKSRHTSPHIAT